MKRLILIIAILSGTAFADSMPAEITTPSGTYSVEVEIDGNTVRCVQCDNGGCATLDSSSYASGEIKI